MPRAKLTFEERVWLEEALNKKVNTWRFVDTWVSVHINFKLKESLAG